MNNLVPRITVNFKPQIHLHIDGNFSNFSVYFSHTRIVGEFF